MPAARPLRFGGLVIPNVGWDEIRRRARQLEDSGFDLVVVDDHISNPVRTTQRWAEAWTALAAIAASTSTIRIGPMVSNTILRHPVVLARQAMTLDDISRGRLEVGLGAGYAPTDFAAVERSDLSSLDLSNRFAEAVATIDALLRGTPPPAGTWFDVSDIELVRPEHARPLPLTIAGDGPISLDTAARWGDRWVSYGGWGLSTADLAAVVRRSMATLDERSEAHGRSAGDVGRTLLAGSAAVNTDPIWTSVDAFEDFVGRFRELGVDTFVFYWPPTAASREVDDRTVDTVVAEVMPRLRNDG